MNEIDNEKEILSQAPDFDNQMKILEEEHQEMVKRRNWIILIISIFLLSVLIFVFSYSTIYFYHEHEHHASNQCDNVNLKVDGSLVPNLNITAGKDCVPLYNIDYHNNRKATFNIDIFGDKSFLFNPTNQKDDNGICIVNCDSNKDGFPDYNIDLNGDGKADINISNATDKKICDLNCDINYDTIPDINIDVDGDGKADVNILIDKTLYNVDYKNNRIPTFNIKNGEEVINPIIDASSHNNCEKNCDTDGDGFPDYNLLLPGETNLVNEVVSLGNKKVNYYASKDRDWKCAINQELKVCHKVPKVYNNVYINIDIDGDGKADVNISSNKGLTVENAINKIINGKTLNGDNNNDGIPDINIDINNDNIPDINIFENGVCIRNCDTNNDGKADYNIYVNDNMAVSIYNINIDVDYDGVCDINCDTNNDLYPDINIDLNGDNIADVNIDFDKDLTKDFNVDINGDFTADENLDAYGIGECNFNCNNQNVVSAGSVCSKNCDTNSDGLPDMYVDINNDGICDFNCGLQSINDADYNFYLDSKYNSGILDVTPGEESNFYILNPLDIKSEGIEPGWNEKYVLRINNNTPYAVKYRIVWENVKNEFSDINNLEYNLYRSNTKFLNDLKAPRKSIVLKDNIIIRTKSSANFVMDILFKETGINQNIDSGKIFKGQLKIEVIN